MCGCVNIYSIYSDTLPERTAYTLTFFSGFWCSIWHLLWHSVWHLFWHSMWNLFWQLFWHSICHLLWHSIWHLFWHSMLALFLVGVLTFFVVYVRVRACPAWSGACDRLRVRAWGSPWASGRRLLHLSWCLLKEEARRSGWRSCTLVKIYRDPHLAGGDQQHVFPALASRKFLRDGTPFLDHNPCIQTCICLAWNKCLQNLVPESVWVKSCSKSGRLLYIFTCSHLHILTCSHTHIFSSSHPHIFTDSHLHRLTPSHTYIFTSSHTYIFTSSHPHKCTSSHIFTHLHTSSLSLSLPHTSSLSLSLSHSSPSHLHIKIVGIFRRLRPAENVLELWKFKVGKASERFLQAISSMVSWGAKSFRILLDKFFIDSARKAGENGKLPKFTVLREISKCKTVGVGWCRWKNEAPRFAQVKLPITRHHQTRSMQRYCNKFQTWSYARIATLFKDNQEERDCLEEFGDVWGRVSDCSRK